MNRVIKCLTAEHGAAIIEYWRGQGVDTGECNGSNFRWCCYYGVINGIFDNYSSTKVKAANATIFELPTETNWEELLKIAGEKYPVGTEYKGIFTDGEIYNLPNFARHAPLVFDEIGIEVGSTLVYHLATDKWAEVVSKVETITEQQAIELLTAKGYTIEKKIIIGAWCIFSDYPIDLEDETPTIRRFKGMKGKLFLGHISSWKYCIEVKIEAV